jgi:GNAT superfamily N-acetyltransferase
MDDRISSTFVTTSLVFEPLGNHPEVLNELAELFEAEWPDWYRSGRGNALQDLQAYSNLDELPVGLIAMREGHICGVAVLKAESIPSHRHLSPWVAAGLVKTALRGQGIGLQLLQALEKQARQLQFTRLYCGTGTAQALLDRAGWHLLAHITHEGKALALYEKVLEQ